MTGGTDKRTHSQADLTSPAPSTRKKPDGRPTPSKGAGGPYVPRGPKPIYPSHHDKGNLINMVKKFTMMAMEPDMDGVRKDRSWEFSKDETMVTKLEDHKMDITNGLEKLMVRTMLGECGAAFNFENLANEVETFITSQIHNILSIEPESTFVDTIRKMANFVKSYLTTELGALNITPKFEDMPADINKKKEILKYTNPLRDLSITVVEKMLTMGVDDRPSIVRGAGLMATLNSEYHEIHNKVAETGKKLDLATIQIAKLTSTVTDQENSDSSKMLVIRGLAEVISAETSGPQNRAEREQEAREYLMNQIGFKSPFSLSLPPSRGKGSGIAIVTTAFDQDKFKLERLISQARSSKQTNISSKRWTPADKEVSNLPELEALAKILKMGMKNRFNKQITLLRASDDSQETELAEQISRTFSDAINNHNYYPRKVIYGGVNSVQYEFQCPISRGIMMIYKDGLTFEDYDFTDPHPNPRLRVMVRTDPSLAAKYGFNAEL